MSRVGRPGVPALSAPLGAGPRRQDLDTSGGAAPACRPHTARRTPAVRETKPLVLPDALVVGAPRHLGDSRRACAARQPAVSGRVPMAPRPSPRVTFGGGAPAIRLPSVRPGLAEA